MLEEFRFLRKSMKMNTYCCSLYGSMTWPLFSAKAAQVFNCWSTCVKLDWDVPRATHTYLVDNLLSGGLPSLRSSVLARYCTFYARLMRSSSLAVRVLANICSHDVRSLTGSNVYNIEKEAKMNILKVSLVNVKAELLALRTMVPLEERWRIGCIKKFL